MRTKRFFFASQPCRHFLPFTHAATSSLAFLIFLGGSWGAASSACRTASTPPSFTTSAAAAGAAFCCASASWANAAPAPTATVAASAIFTISVFILCFSCFVVVSRKERKVRKGFAATAFFAAEIVYSASSTVTDLMFGSSSRGMSNAIHRSNAAASQCTIGDMNMAGEAAYDCLYDELPLSS